MLQLNARDRDRLVVLRQIHGGQLSVSEGSRRLKLSLRQVRRMLRRFEVEGDASVIHRGRGKASNRRRPEEVRARVLERAREEVYRGFGPTLLAEHRHRAARRHARLHDPLPRPTSPDRACGCARAHSRKAPDDRNAARWIHALPLGARHTSRFNRTWPTRLRRYSPTLPRK